LQNANQIQLSVLDLVGDVMDETNRKLITDGN
jgi:hypothetical protein